MEALTTRAMTAVRVLAYSDSRVHSGAEAVFVAVCGGLAAAAGLSLRCAIAAGNGELRMALEQAGVAPAQILEVRGQPLRLAGLWLWSPRARRAARRLLSRGATRRPVRQPAQRRVRRHAAAGAASPRGLSVGRAAAHPPLPARRRHAGGRAAQPLRERRAAGGRPAAGDLAGRAVRDRARLGGRPASHRRPGAAATERAAVPATRCPRAPRHAGRRPGRHPARACLDPPEGPRRVRRGSGDRAARAARDAVRHRRFGPRQRRDRRRHRRPRPERVDAHARPRRSGARAVGHRPRRVSVALRGPAAGGARSSGDRSRGDRVGRRRPACAVAGPAGAFRPAIPARSPPASSACSTAPTMRSPQACGNCATRRGGSRRTTARRRSPRRSQPSAAHEPLHADRGARWARDRRSRGARRGSCRRSDDAPRDARGLSDRRLRAARGRRHAAPGAPGRGLARWLLDGARGALRVRRAGGSAGGDARSGPRGGAVPGALARRRRARRRTRPDDDRGRRPRGADHRAGRARRGRPGRCGGVVRGVGRPAPGAGALARRRAPGARGGGGRLRRAGRGGGAVRARRPRPRHAVRRGEVVLQGGSYLLLVARIAMPGFALWIAALLVQGRRGRELALPLGLLLLYLVVLVPTGQRTFAFESAAVVGRRSSSPASDARGRGSWRRSRCAACCSSSRRRRATSCSRPIAWPWVASWRDWPPIGSRRSAAARSQAFAGPSRRSPTRHG